MSASHPIDVSIIIVNYNVKHFADQCLRSIFASQNEIRYEVLLVDNSSSDGSVEYLQSRHPNVEYIVNDKNVGFGRANNIALKRAQGRYLLILNPDTILGEDSLSAMIEYMDAHPKAGAMGPKILTRDGSFDISSKRGFPTPWVAFCRLSGLGRIFPRSKLFGKYNLLYLDPDKSAEVDSLAGSCMLVKQEVYEEVGGFDEDFFMYGEDIDWCYRIKAAGWQIHYAPVTRIVHFKGESTRRSRIDRDRAFYGAMHLFVEKRLKGHYSAFAHRLIDLGIILALVVSRLTHLWKYALWPLIDWVGLWSILALGRFLRWGAFGLNFNTGLAVTIQATIWILCLAVLGVYRRNRGQLMPVVWSMALGFLVNSSFTYFFKQFAFSRFLNLFGLVVGGFFVWGWRMLLRELRGTHLYHKFYNRRTLLVGTGQVGRAVLKRLNSGDLPYVPVGFIDPEKSMIGNLIDGFPVLGEEDDLPRLVEQEEIDEVLFAYEQSNYNRVLDRISHLSRKKGVNFKVITPEITQQENGFIPFLSVEYLSPNVAKNRLRKVATLVLGRKGE